MLVAHMLRCAVLLTICASWTFSPSFRKRKESLGNKWICPRAAEPKDDPRAHFQLGRCQKPAINALETFLYFRIKLPRCSQATPSSLSIQFCDTLGPVETIDKVNLNICLILLFTNFNVINDGHKINISIWYAIKYSNQMIHSFIH